MVREAVLVFFGAGLDACLVAADTARNRAERVVSGNRRRKLVELAVCVGVQFGLRK